MGPEASLWKTLKPILEGQKCFCTRLENRHGGGVPDVYVASPVGIFMLELKISSKTRVRLADMQIAYNTLLNHKHGLSFILAEDPGPRSSLQNAKIFAFEDPKSLQNAKISGSVGSGSLQNAKKARGPRTKDLASGSVGSGRVGPRYYLWHGRDAVDVGRSGTRAEVLASGDSLSDMVAVMVAVCREHHRELLEKDPGR